ncbi:DUF3530 family protein [Neptuniibacter sp. 2_MG-2023]|uniref:DUF3530 family protein n=1 Tax=Neptuniibacter sp. 2_MG-2023 TaxID=3062671 RepID=UPI0026E1ED8E|nr:DUF3530 family protein [Neptuniibacter sp. 2_MG-2023]MDO6512987.1 DUF3530 family protein [Neptuniibacter sp. 2_MG-2023]
MKLILPILASILTFTSLSYAADNEDSTAAPSETSAPLSPAVQKPRIEPSVDENRIQELVKNTPEETELLQLDTGKADEKLIGFYRTEGSGITQGGIIIFPDQHTHMAWPDNLKYLSEGLSEFGWYTLAIYLPQPAIQPIPERTLPTLSNLTPTNTSTESETPEPANNASSTKETSSTPTADTPKEPYEETIFRLGKTAISYMEARDNLDRFIIIGIGTGATWAAQYVNKYQEEQDLRLLMVDAKSPTDNSLPNLSNILPEIKDTIIDLHHSSPRSSATNLTQNAPNSRLRLARHNKMDNFHQSRMPAMTDNWKRNSSWLLKHVRGTINTYVIKAEEAERAIKLNNKIPSNEQAPGQ